MAGDAVEGVSDLLQVLVGAKLRLGRQYCLKGLEYVEENRKEFGKGFIV